MRTIALFAMFLAMAGLLAGCSSLGRQTDATRKIANEDLPEGGIPRPGSIAELTNDADQAIARDNERWAKVEAERKAWFSENAVGGHRIRMIEDGAELTRTRMELLRGARRSIFIATYSITNDENGRLLTDVLCEKAKSGLDVRMEINQMSSAKYLPLAQKLKACGAFIVFAKQALVGIQYAVHQKLFIVDGEKVILGGSGYDNFYTTASRTSYEKLKKNAWYDMDFEVEGPAACRFYNFFRDDFLASARAGLDYDPALDDAPKGERGTEKGRYFGLAPTEAKAAFEAEFGIKKFVPCSPIQAEGDGTGAIPIFNNPHFSKARPILEAHISAILAAKYSGSNQIRLYAPYFVPGRDFVEALLWARRNGLEVSVLTNSTESNDEGLKTPIIVATLKTAMPLIDAGVKIYLWKNKSTMHRKGGIFGDAAAFVGSDNLDNRGQEYSSESVLYSNDPKLIQQLTSDFDHDIPDAILVDRAYVSKFMGEAGWFWKLSADLLKKFF